MYKTVKHTYTVVWCIASVFVFRHPPLSALADLMAEVMTLNTRITPYYERFSQLLRQDPDFSGNVRTA